MQVGIYTNRLPSPPIGGIPSFLNGLFHGLKSVGVRARFLLPNASHDVRNGFVSQGSIESALAIALRDTSQLPSDVTISLSDWRSEGLYSPDELVPLAGLSTTDMVGCADFCDLMIIAGSPLLFLSASSLEEFMRKLRCPILLVVLFPFQEIAFYCGSTRTHYDIWDSRKAVAVH